MAITIPPRYNELSLRPGNSGSRGSFNLISDDRSLRTGSENAAKGGVIGAQSNGARAGALSSYASFRQSARSTMLSADSARTLAGIEQSTSALRTSADRLVKNRTLFDADQRDRAYEAVQGFASDYNALLDSTQESAASAIESKRTALSYLTSKQEGALASIGISIGEDGKLSVDEAAFRAASPDKAKELFFGAGSYGYAVSAQAAMIDYQANYEAAKAGTYTQSGAYGSTNSAGSIFDTGI